MKEPMATIAERNRVVDRIIAALDERLSFLIVGHTVPDEDCLSSMVGFALLAKKFAKSATLLLEGAVHDNFEYLLRICKYNAIDVAYALSEIPDYDTIVVCDTAKPALLARCEGIREAIESRVELVIEVDHHLESDSRYHADRAYALVDRATSSSELVGIVAYKLTHKRDFLDERHLPEIFTRNLVLSILTGIVGDTQMGKFLQDRKERRMYHAFTVVFGSLLNEKTTRRGHNYASVEQLFGELQKLSKREEQCFDAIFAMRRKKDAVGYVYLDGENYARLLTEYGDDALSTVLRTVADTLAEESGFVSLVVFSGRPKGSELVQCRARRSKRYKDIDLRDVLSRFGIENGGGHQGAVGFRVPIAQIEDTEKFVDELVDGINSMVAEATPL